MYNIKTSITISIAEQVDVSAKSEIALVVRHHKKTPPLNNFRGRVFLIIGKVFTLHFQ
ncbi:hypothetical protein BPO_0265 [Bergeyella porcorum]|uniref:Uncharacterized protein n=1 Tax=Bergeyella porcorum TaxID=1735111 RepID=A0AAU0F2E7_9FLAO